MADATRASSGSREHGAEARGSGRAGRSRRDPRILVDKRTTLNRGPASVVREACVLAPSGGHLFWLRNDAELLQHPELVELRPALGDLSVLEARDDHAGYRRVLSGRWDSREISALGPGRGDALYDEVALGDLLLDLEAKIRDRAAVQRGDLLQPLRPGRDGVDRK